MNVKWLLLILILSSCGNQKEKAQSTDDDHITTERTQEISVSSLTFPLDFPVNDLTAVINRALPEVLVDDTIQLKNEEHFIRIKIEPTGDIKLKSSSNKLDASLPMKVRAHVETRLLGIKTNKKIDFEVRVDMRTVVSIENDWDLGTKCKIRKIQWIEPPILEVLGIKINLQKQIEKKLFEKSDAIEEKVCTAIHKLVPLRQQVEKIWHLISNAHRVTRKPMDIWLTSNPSVFSAYFSKNVEDTLRVIIHAESEVFITPLDGLEYEEKPIPKNTFAQLDSEDQLDIKVNVNIPYKKLDRILESLLDSTSFSYQGASATLKKFSSGTIDNKLRLLFDIEGLVDVSIDAIAYPHLNEKNNLVIDSIDYQVESENSLISLADWLSNDTLTEYLKLNSKVDLSQVLDSLDSKIVKAMNRSKVGSKVDLNMDFHELKTDTLIFTEYGFHWFFDVQGNAHVYLSKEIANKPTE